MIGRMLRNGIVVLILCLPAYALQVSGATRGSALADVQQHIKNTWKSLTRSLSDCSALQDKKSGGKVTLYLPAEIPIPPDVAALSPKCNVMVERLPVRIEKLGAVDVSKIAAGLLYLPNPYVVPGGRFNEMYGWDSYFIILGLIRDGKLDLARGMADNFMFEIEHYGAVLNANRSYYLTRSQPPFFTSMVLAVEQAEARHGNTNRTWLERAYADAVRDHAMWTTGPHLAGTTGLSRYYDFGEGPVPEEAGTYPEVAHDMLKRLDTRYFVPVASPLLAEPAFTIFVCDQGLNFSTKSCPQVQTVSLSADYYKGDRSMRESGFDISFRFGPFGGETHHYAPVDLNSLLYKSERDLAKIATMLGKQHEAQHWLEQAEARRQIMQELFWDAEQGQFFDYDFTRQKRSTYEFATTFYPLWTGWATPGQARSVVEHTASFAQPGGVVTSLTNSGVQWDWPYGWAPLQLITVEGIRRYGFISEANRISKAWLSMVLENFRRDGTLREKYNVVTLTSETSVTAGYGVNVVGFGWTNGVFVTLLDQLPKDQQLQLLRFP